MTAARAWWGRSHPAALPAVVLAVVLFATASRYGFHGDELYFRMLPLAWWYDDQPPLTVWFAHLAASVSDGVWLQRVPAILIACAGSFVASAFARVAGHGRDAQRIAAWAHAFTVYPLLMGHVFLTASLDLLAWQLVLLSVVAAMQGHPWGLTAAGIVAGVACWNKLLVVVLVGAVVVALAVVDRRQLASRDALVGAVAFTLVGAPQALAQLLHGMPMARVSANLVVLHGGTNRWLILPLLVVFLGPPLAPIWWRGLRWRPKSANSRLPLLVVVGVLVLGWNLVVPGQPYYAVAAFLPALALGWGASRHTDVWRRRRVVVAANAAVAALLCLPIVPPTSGPFVVVAVLDPVARDQVGWPQLASAVDDARGPVPAQGRAVVTDSYAIAGALARFGERSGIGRSDIASGHDALWSIGPPPTEAVLLVGDHVAAQRGVFDRCESAGALPRVGVDPYELAGKPMWRCEGLRGAWANVWPQFRHLGG